MFWSSKNRGAASLVAFTCLLVAVSVIVSRSESSNFASSKKTIGYWQKVSVNPRPLAIPTKANGQEPTSDVDRHRNSTRASPKNRIASPPRSSASGDSAEAINAGQVAQASWSVPEFRQLPQLQDRANYQRNVHYPAATETISQQIGIAGDSDATQQFTALEGALSENHTDFNAGQFYQLNPPAPPAPEVHQSPQLQHNGYHQGVNHQGIEHHSASTETVPPPDPHMVAADASEQFTDQSNSFFLNMLEDSPSSNITANAVTPSDSQQVVEEDPSQFTTLEEILQRLDKQALSGESVSLLKQLRQFRIRDLSQIWSELNLHFSNSYHLPLMTAVQSGIDRNLTALNQRANVDLVQSTILQAESQFEPQLNLNVNNNNGSSALSPVGGAPAAIPGTDNDLNGLSFTSQLAVPNKLGGTLQLANSLASINDSLDSVTVAPTASFVQPLLRGAGRDVNLSGIRAAELNTLAAGKQAEETTFLVAAQIKVAYLDLFLAQENLRIFDWIVQVAEFQDRWITARKEAGAESSLNVRRGRTGLGNLKLQLEQATQQALLAERVLKELMLLPELNVGSPIKLELEDIRISKDAILPSLNSEQFTAMARQFRPELQRLNLQIQAFDQNLLAAENQIRPQVNLVGSLSGQLSSAESGAGVVEDEFHQVTLGINTNFPLRGNQAAKAAIRQIMAQRHQAVIVREQQDVAIVREVNDALDQLVFSWRRIQVAREIIENANLAYIGEILTVQRADLLLQATQTLADAFTNFNQAVRDYYVAEINLQLATGSVLNHKLQLFR